MIAHCPKCGWSRPTTQTDPAMVLRGCPKGGRCEVEIDGRAAAKEGHATPEQFPCLHRSDKPLREEVCDLCGSRGRLVDVFACSKYGECTISRWRKGTDHNATCLTCEDREEPDA